MSTGAPLRLYRFATGLAEPGGRLFLEWRARQGKEDRARLKERLGFPGQSRPDGPLAWVHGASVGEGLAVLPFVERLVARGFAVLVTTGTLTSGRLLATRLPEGAFHQFIPLDLPGAARHFVEAWRPDFVAFAESELWPNLLGEAVLRGIPVVIVNARMSARSSKRWKRLSGVIGPLLASLDLVLAQSAADATRFAQLGASRILDVGNMKFDGPPPAADPQTLDALLREKGLAPCWLAASIHPGEEADCLEVHRRLAVARPDLVTILVPRHRDRGPAIVEKALAAGLPASLRSRGDAWKRSRVYVADTMGELGLFFRLADVVFVGKSLIEKGGGQNPIEPAKLGRAILHGPHVANFASVYAMLDENGGSCRIEDGAGLATAVADLLDRPERRTSMAERAQTLAQHSGGATERTMVAIEPLLAARMVTQP